MLLEPDLKQVLLPQGVVCFDPGDPINQVYFPHNGMISCLVTTGDGEMVETSSVGSEGALGLQCGLGQRVSFTRAMVQIGGKFSVISASRFEFVDRTQCGVAGSHHPLHRNAVGGSPAKRRL